MKHHLSHLVSIALYISIVVSCFTACKQNKGTADLQSTLPKGLDSTQVIQLIDQHTKTSLVDKSKFFIQDSIALWTMVDSLYNQSNQLFWHATNSFKLNEAGQQLLTLIESSDYHGFNPSFYGYEALKEAATYTPSDSIKPEEKLKIVAQNDILFSAAFLAYAKDLHQGRIKTKWETPDKKRNYIADLQKACADNKIKEYFDSIAPLHPDYYVLLNKLKKLNDAQKNGGLPTIKSGGSYTKGKKNEDIQNLISYLTRTGDLDQSSAKDEMTDEVVEAVKKFQKRSSLGASGIVDGNTVAKMNKPIADAVDKLKLNIERMRWLPQDLGKKYAWVNIPEFELHVYENYKSVYNSIVVVGDPAKQTPIILKPMTHIVFSPVWNVPAEIGREEIQKWLHINPNLLIVAGVEVFFKGKKVEDPLSINWTPELAKSKDYSFKVKPSDNNALGDVKFMFPNHHNVYLHDTNNQAAFSDANRAQSAGCIRVLKDVEFAENLLAPQNWSRAAIQSKMGIGKEMSVNLKEPVPVYLYYLTNFIDTQGDLRERADVYGHDRRQLAVWKQYDKR